MDHDQLAIHEVNIHLDAVCTQFQCLAHGAKGVLGFMARRTAMAETE